MLKILIVDDDPAVRLILKKIIKFKMGYEVFEAINGQDALDQLSIIQPDLVILDLSMPVLDGYGFLNEVRHNDNYNDLPVIILTCLQEKTIVTKVIKLGITDYFVKPLKFKSTLHRLETIFHSIENKITYSVPLFFDGN